MHWTQVLSAGYTIQYSKKLARYSYQNILKRQSESEVQFEDIWVQFVIDCFNLAYSRCCKTRTLKYSGVLKAGSKKHDKFRGVAKACKIKGISPYSLFCFLIEHRRSRKILPTIENVCTLNGVEHYLAWIKKNKYKSALLSEVKTFLDTVKSTFRSDLDVYTTYRLRSVQGTTLVKVSNFFGEYSSVLLYYAGVLQDSNLVLVEDLEFRVQEKSELVASWNTILKDKQAVLRKMVTSYTDPAFSIKVSSLIETLDTFKIHG